MKQKLFMVLAAVILLVSLTLSGCGGGGTVTVTNTTTATTTVTNTAGVSQADYDSLQNQLAVANHELTVVQGQLGVSEGAVNSLEAQVAALQAANNNSGLTTGELVKKIAAEYFVSHYYSKDVYDCNNMASDLWDMYKKLGITSRIVVGDVDNVITDILASTHAWVMVDLGSGQSLAVDATNGEAYTQAEKPLYYRGWTFNNPDDLKRNDDLKTEYNTRVAFVNTLVSEINAAMTLYNNSANQTEADKYLELYNKLKELKDDQEALLLQLKAQIEGLATPLY